VPKVAVLDDWQDVATTAADWSVLKARAEVVFFAAPFSNGAEAAAALSEFEIVMAMRERTPFPVSLIDRLPALRMFNLTGNRAALVDIDALAARGVTVCYTGGGESGVATAELAFGLILASARGIAGGDAALRSGRFQEGVAAGFELAGKTLGLIGLGRIGSLVAGYGRAFGMDVIAWSPNLTQEKAHDGGVRYAGKDELLRIADILSLHLVLSDRTRGLLGAGELALLKPGAVLVNTSRSGLLQRDALLDALREGRIFAALDVYDREPLPQDDPLRSLPNTLLTPHIGYASIETYAEFYRQGVENVIAYLEGQPIRVLRQPAVRTG
jgi:phosphoglycerate dehydrogenase-like enzyme